MPGGGWCNYLGDICYCDTEKYSSLCFYEQQKINDDAAATVDERLLAEQVASRRADIARGWF